MLITSILIHIAIFCVIASIIGLYTYGVIKSSKIIRVALIITAAIVIELTMAGVFAKGVTFGKAVFIRTMRASLERMADQLDKWENNQDHDKISKAIDKLKEELGNSSGEYKPDDARYYMNLFEIAVRE